jgi:hypothetical protein
VPKIKARMSGSRGKAQKKTLYISLSKIWSNGRGDAIDMDGRSGGLLCLQPDKTEKLLSLEITRLQLGGPWTDLLPMFHPECWV